jgi:hypothetical protein
VTVDNTGKIVAQGYGVNSEEVYGDGVATITATSVIEGKTNINAIIKVTVTRSAVFSISFDQLGDAAPPIAGKTLSMTANKTTPVEFTLTNPSLYDVMLWTVNGTDDEITSDTATLSLTASQFANYGLGTFTITLEVKTKTTTTAAGRWYSKTIDLELVE